MNSEESTSKDCALRSDLYFYVSGCHLLEPSRYQAVGVNFRDNFRTPHTGSVQGVGEVLLTCVISFSI